MWLLFRGFFDRNIIETSGVILIEIEMSEKKAVLAL